MPLAGVLTARSVMLLAAVVLLSASAPGCHAEHNISAILSGRRDLAEFSRALTDTGLADDINTRNTITVLAVDDAHMAPLKARHLPRDTLRRVLSLHVLVDYYDDAKLRRLPGGSADVSTLFQASGDAPGSAGMIKIAERRGGRVAFAPQDDDGGGGGGARGDAAVFYVGTVHAAPYNISVLEVSAVIESAAAEAPSSSASPASDATKRNVTDAMSKGGCARFARLVAATPDAAATFDRAVSDLGGLTAFCPSNKAVAVFEPTLKTLRAASRLALVLYHGVPAHYSPQALREDTQDLTTLDTDGHGDYIDMAVRVINNTVTLVSATRNKARVTRTLVDANPLAVYMIDAVLVPDELPAQAPGHSGGKDADGNGNQKNGAAGPSWPLCWPWCRCVAMAPTLLFVLMTAFAC